MTIPKMRAPRQANARMLTDTKSVLNANKHIGACYEVV
jgi:hypothetical protein